MGQSPSADLYFGYDLGVSEFDYDTGTSSEPEWMQEGADWEDELARRLGWVEVPDPSDGPRLQRLHWSAPDEERRAALDAYQRARDEYAATSLAYRAHLENEVERTNVLAAVPVELSTYGSSEGETQYAIRVKASVQRVNDYGSTPLNPLVEGEEWRDQLARFVELLGFDLGDKQPGWHLNCSYG